MTKKEKLFVKTVWDFYHENGRHSLPWRKTKNPYFILVSELMLQQTQVERVIPKYKSFIRQWPTVRRLAAAPLGEVLKVWQGLGYNRRAKFLWETAIVVSSEHNGVFPKSLDELKKLPGVGAYTAAAVSVFAYNLPVPLIETNVRTVFIHHFFSNRNDVSDKEILKLVEKTLPQSDARNWYAALMDYGSYLKKTNGNLNHKSTQYKKQSVFKGSDREVRGAILKYLTVHAKATKKNISTTLPFDKEKIDLQLKNLEAEGLIVKNNTSYILP